MYDKNIIGKVIKARREKAGLSQKELGELIGMSQQQLSQYESGTRRPKLETVSKMAKALNMSDDELRNILEITTQSGNDINFDDFCQYMKLTA